MNAPAINIPRPGPLTRFFHLLLLPSHAMAQRPDLRRQIEATIAPLPPFGLPDDPVYELTGSFETLCTLADLLVRMPSHVTLGCVTVFENKRLCGVHLTGSALRIMYREISARQANAVRALLGTGNSGDVDYPAWAAMERVRRLLSTALGLSVRHEAAIE